MLKGLIATQLILIVVSISHLQNSNGESNQKKTVTPIRKRNVVSFYKRHRERISRKRTFPEEITQIGEAPKRQTNAAFRCKGKTPCKKTTAQKNNPRSPRVRRLVSTPSLACSGEFSCRNKCSYTRKISYENKLSCYCDVDCEFFHDCCADFDDFCRADGANSTVYNTTFGHSQNHTLTSNSSLINKKENKRADKYIWGCFPFKGMIQGSRGIWMIGSCPKSWPKDDIFYKCRNLSDANKITKDNYNYLPVYTSNGRVYHNRFCAQCNGIDLNKTNSYELSLSPSCNKSLINLNTSSNATRSKCVIEGWRPARGDPRRNCLKMRSTCPYSYLKEQCMNGKVRIVNNNKCIFKNIYCAKCNNGLNRLKCGPNMTGVISGCEAIALTPTPDHGPPSTLPPFPTMPTFPMTHHPVATSEYRPRPLGDSFDIYTKQPLTTLLPRTITCSVGKVYDKFTKMCRETIDNIDIIQQGEAFKDVFKELSYRQVIAQYEFMLWLQNTSNCFQRFESLNLDVEIAEMVNVSKLQVTGSVFVNTSSILVFHLRIKENETIYTDFMFQRIANFTSKFNISIAGEFCTVINATSRKIECSSLETYNRSEYTLSKDQSIVTINETGEIIKSEHFYINGTSVNDSQSIIVCRRRRRRTLNCSSVWFFLRDGEFVVLENHSIFVNASKMIYEPSYYTWQNLTLYICENFTSSYQVIISTISASNDFALSLMTLLGMSISIIALVFVLVTYSLFSELRTPPGINLMNLSVSILLGQLLWLVGSGRTGNPMACTAIAVLLHYFFLVSFVWTSIIAFDTWRAFTAKGRRSFTDSRRKRLRHNLRYMAVGWLSVMVYVATCVVIDFTKVYKIGYESTKACWMSDSSAILYFFAVPIAVILLLNFTLYTLTMKAIHVTKSQTKVATDDKNRKKSFAVYVRIASAMGFTWIIGFIAPFGWNFLWYLFVVLNGLQGLYIAVAFVFNQRVMKLYKRLLLGNAGNTSKKVSTVTQTSGIQNETMNTKF